MITFDKNPNGEVAWVSNNGQVPGQCARMSLCLFLKLVSESETEAEFRRKFWELAVYDLKGDARLARFARA